MLIDSSGCSRRCRPRNFEGVPHPALDGQRAGIEPWTKVDGDLDVAPTPEIRVTASRLQEKAQSAAKASSEPYWTDGGLPRTTDHGTPIDPRNFVCSSKRIVSSGRGPADPGPRHPPHLCVADGRARRAPSGGHGDPVNSKIAVTMEIYTKVPSDVIRQALKRLGDLLGETGR